MTSQRWAGVLILLMVFSCAEAWPQIPVINAGYTEINLSDPSKSQVLKIAITNDQSRAYGWKPGKNILIRIGVRTASGKILPFRDVYGRTHWRLKLNAQGEAELSLLPNPDNYSGEIVVRGGGKMLIASTPYLGNYLGKTVEKVYQYTFKDGASIKVHYTDSILEASLASKYLPSDVLGAAVMAYQTITQFKGFSTAGYSFANPDKNYAYDPDKTIDIYLGVPSDELTFRNHGFSGRAFKDAPCFDTVKLSETQYHAVILIPANYKEFIQKWEKINPSSLGKRDLDVDLKGTLIHEMLHTLIFYYNKNLNKEIAPPGPDAAPVTNAKKIDWYVEGLARYFETFAGAKHDFYSQGFKETLPDKIRFSRGGSNYFMRYPDQAFIDLRYENALFWRFMDQRYGMEAIERLAREFRDYDKKGNRSALEKITKGSFEKLLKEFAMASLEKDFSLKDESVHLKEIARTQLTYRDERLYLDTGVSGESELGETCETDWIGRWDGIEAEWQATPIAGDNTEKSDVSGWATDFYQINIDASVKKLPYLEIALKEGGYSLLTQIVIVTRSGSQFKQEMEEVFQSGAESVDLERTIKQNGLSAKDVDKIFVLITNTDPIAPADYKLNVSSKSA